MARPTRRDDLLDAAERVVRRDGAAHLTLDAVAAEAGTSKGGLLYHFATKEALLAALVARLVESFGTSLGRAVDADPDPRGRWTRAYVRIAADPDGTSPEDATAVGLLAALAADPALVDPLRARYVEWRARLLDDGLPEEDALIVALAADGLWMADLLGFAAPEGDLRRRTIDRMIAMTGGLDR
jgi:AcrR family transcriptional regulator